MLESTKEGATGLPEGSDIGLGARCREFESPHSDQKAPEISRFQELFNVIQFGICGAEVIWESRNMKT